MSTLRRLPTLLVVLTLAAQVLVALEREPPSVRVTSLGSPPSVAALRVMSLDQPALAARLAMLWLQAYDYQPGVSLPFARLDYAAVEAWLARMLDLDAGFDYPLLAAARLYGEVAEPTRQRRMIDFLARACAADLPRRWPWLAHAVYLARHRLHDLPLALSLAETLERGGPAVPSFARQMRIFVLADMGEVEAARVLLGALIASGEVRDPHEQAFLHQRLAELEGRMHENSTGK